MRVEIFFRKRNAYIFSREKLIQPFNFSAKKIVGKNFSKHNELQKILLEWPKFASGDGIPQDDIGEFIIHAESAIVYSDKSGLHIIGDIIEN